MGKSPNLYPPTHQRILVLSFHCDTRKKCNLRSYTASFGASIWTETSISSSQEMYFRQNKEGGTFRLVQFQSSDEAEQLYGALMRCRHPNLAHVLQFTSCGLFGMGYSYHGFKDFVRFLLNQILLKLSKSGEANMCADFLAKEALQLSNGNVVLSDMPPDLDDF
ncbi:hypothetical protein LOK49_LG12G00523 [Camellia lanceoleosa]|uniref:Uncharacterized protein n=1 Tax=Camellia lanceoleosa TaxID=1840588 RepID=A0ACC0FUM9_9ERIC|nr:hypothetical protein LOK49_LG12G00523 [Camellia lanceoleosa]